MPTTLPQPGMLARLRNRLAIISDVREWISDTASEHLVEVDYADQFLPTTDSVLWHLEPAAEVVPPDGYPRILETGPMHLKEFEALKRSVRWSALNGFVTEAGPDLPIVAPFLGGVQVEDYQLVPLARALSMPRVTLGLFDDVGLGKTIEAGLVIGELIRRRRIRRILVLCPAWIRKQWKDEMESKFGLDFALVDRDETSQLRRQLGMETNPWTTFPRVIASYHYLKQEDVLGEFLIGSRSAGSSAATLPWDLLIVDEAHNCMPAAHGRDSDLAQMLVRIGKLFEHKVFLSATPHNGFTQSFTGLLSQLDPVRFNKKDSITAAERKRVGEVVVRRLKKDINGIDEENGRVPRFAERELVPAIKLQFGERERALITAFEVFRKDFKRVVASSRDAATRIAGNFVIEVLSKRLLSCPYTFAVSWSRFRRGMDHDDEATSQAVRAAAETARAETDRDDETETRLATATRLAGAWTKGQRDRLKPAMTRIDEALSHLGLVADQEESVGDPVEDARVESLISLVRERLGAGQGWNSGERLIVFTEYRTTLDYLVRRMTAAFPSEPPGRFLQLYGGMPERDRESVKAAFNDPADEVRILLATDAASEGANLQETARMVLHFDLPWNPARIDQRNGRLDRHGQSRNVLIYHFTSESDSDLRFLGRLFEKLETIREELGAMGKLFDEVISRRFLVTEGASTETLFNEDQVLTELEEKARVVRRRQRADLEPTKEDGRQHRDALSRLQAAIDLDAVALRETLEIAMRTGGEPFSFIGPEEQNRYRMQNVPQEFKQTVDATLRKRTGTGVGALLSVQFAADDQLVDIKGRKVYRPPKDSSLLHLGHPLVRQALQALSVSRFPGSKRHATISRWTVTMGPVPQGAKALILVTLEEMAVNRMRETFHQWVSVLGLPVMGDHLGKRLPYVTPAVERSGAIEAFDLSQEAKDLWLDLEDDVEKHIHVYTMELEAKIRAKLAKVLATERAEQVRLYDERYASLTKQLSRDLSSKRSEIDALKAQMDELTLFEEDKDRKRMDQSKLEEEMEEDRAQCREMIAFLEQEHRRMIEEVIPKRYELPDHVLAYPVAVEIRFTEARA